MKHRICIILLMIISLFISYKFSSAEKERGFKVIVHAENPTSELTRKEISQLFLKKVKQWKHFEKKVEPVDLTEDSPIREEFSREIHDRKLSSIKAYWQKKIFSGRDVPPLEKETDEDVLAYVDQNRGAIGYIAVEATIDDYGVSVIEIVE